MIETTEVLLTHKEIKCYFILSAMLISCHICVKKTVCPIQLGFHYMLKHFTTSLIKNIHHGVIATKGMI